MAYYGPRRPPGSKVRLLSTNIARTMDGIRQTVLDIRRAAAWLESRPEMALFYTDYSLGFLGLRDGRWKFIYTLDSGRSKLFDLVADPGETRDLASGQPGRVNAYRDAARHVEGLTEGLDVILADGRIRTIPGVGDAIALKIQELLETGKLDAETTNDLETWTRFWHLPCAVIPSAARNLYFLALPEGFASLVR